MSGRGPDRRREYLKTKRKNQVLVRVISSNALIHALREHLRQVRTQGWAMDDKERQPGPICVGAPIYDDRDERITRRGQPRASGASAIPAFTGGAPAPVARALNAAV